jgi:hypothetical protein
MCYNGYLYTWLYITTGNVGFYVLSEKVSGNMSESVTYHLWLLECKDGYLTRLSTFYALNKVDAESQVQDLLQECPDLERVSLRLCPEGFRFLWFIRPGTITCNAEEL